MQRMYQPEEQTQRNTDDIHALTVNVTRIATLVEQSEKARASEREMLTQAIGSINKLNERIGSILSLEKEIAALTTSLAEKNGDIRTVKHDLANLSHAMSAMPIFNDRIAKHDTKIEVLEKWQDNFDGARGALSWVGHAVWGVFGTGFLTLCYFVIKLFVTSNGGTTIGGE